MQFETLSTSSRLRMTTSTGYRVEGEVRVGKNDNTTINGGAVYDSTGKWLCNISSIDIPQTTTPEELAEALTAMVVFVKAVNTKEEEKEA